MWGRMLTRAGVVKGLRPRTGGEGEQMLGTTTLRRLGLAVLGTAVVTVACDAGPGAEVRGDTAAETTAAPETERADRRTASRSGRAVVPTGTVLTLRLNESVSTETHQIGDSFTAEVLQDIRSEGGQTLIPEGAVVTGRVERSRRRQESDGQSLLAFRLTSLEIQGEDHLLDVTIQRARSASGDGEGETELGGRIAIGSAAGALVGRVAGRDVAPAVPEGAAGTPAGSLIALASRDEDAVFPEESRLRVELNEPILVRESEE